MLDNRPINTKVWLIERTLNTIPNTVMVLSDRASRITVTNIAAKINADTILRIFKILIILYFPYKIANIIITTSDTRIRELNHDPPWQLG
jgi:hypothetical protein